MMNRVTRPISSVAILLTMAAAVGCSRQVADIRVVVWDERQKEQLHAYDGQYLGDVIADGLRSRPEFTVTSVGQAEHHDLPSIERLVADCDVLIWWGHLLHDQVSPEVGRMIVQRIKAGKLNLIALHSAHWATPFVEAMNERARHDALERFATEPGDVEFEEVAPPAKGAIFVTGLEKLRTARPTPHVEPRKFPDGTTKVKLHLPYCVFPAFREDGKPSEGFTRAPGHPVARGIPPRFTLPQTEMYDEPFHVPEPDVVVFEERWPTGEWFRSGCVWRLGDGSVFYFRPGHETYPVFKDEWAMKILENAARWMGTKQH